MDRTEVVVRRPQGPEERLRFGAVLSRTGTLATVRWDDDGAVEENVRLGGESLLAVVGTRRHQFLMDLPALIERFAADPVTVIVELLRENPRGLKAQAIKENLTELGLETAVVDRTWRSVQTKLSRRADVHIKANTYKWVSVSPAEEPITPTTSPAKIGGEVNEPEAPAPMTLSTAALDGLVEQATVDAYDDDEQISGLRAMLDEHLALPFQTFVLGVEVTVKEIDSRPGSGLVAICWRGSHRQVIGLLDLPMPAPRPAGAEWIDAYRHWSA